MTDARSLGHLLDPGNVLSSRAVPGQVLSAREGLTSVFGMGTGGSLQLLSPEILSAARLTFRFAAPLRFFPSGFSPLRAPPSLRASASRFRARTLKTAQYSS